VQVVVIDFLELGVQVFVFLNRSVHFVTHGNSPQSGLNKRSNSAPPRSLELPAFRQTGGRTSHLCFGVDGCFLFTLRRDFPCRSSAVLAFLLVQAGSNSGTPTCYFRLFAFNSVITVSSIS